ncbi:MAG TPA: ankyrin repeat domain-containing protein [Pirellulales bacterium]|nr:ankyrin repeat domain-containing protein [Pirellulales bacterium]
MKRALPLLHERWPARFDVSPAPCSRMAAAAIPWGYCCKRFKIAWPVPDVRISRDGFQVLDAEGRPMQAGLRGYVRVGGPEIAAGENEAADALAEAIDRCDPEGIRAAVARGASLTVLPDTSTSPLLAALFKFEEPEWRECVELLIELGCHVNGVNKDPPIVVCVDERFLDEPDALEAVELLLERGADVNATDADGQTALFRSVLDQRVELVRLLLEHGANPDIKDRNGVSPVDWLRKACERETNFQERTVFAELLSLLTGQPVAKPQAATLTPALAAESKRFRMCVTARRLLPLLNANLSIRRWDDYPYAKRRWFRDREQQLADAGFQFAQHFGIGLSNQSAFTNPDLGFDAILSAGDKPGCEIIAYHSDHTTTTVTNSTDVVGPEFAPPSRVLKEVQGASPAQLVEYLRDLARGKEMMRVDAASFASRYTEALNRVARETGERARHVLETPTLLVDGSPPRYERLGCYLDFADWKDPGYSSENWVRDWKEKFAKADRDPPDSTSDAVDAAMYLVVMRHFQFASAPEPGEFLASGGDVALAHFRAIARAAKGCTHAEPWFQFRSLVRGLLLCAWPGAGKRSKR